MKHIKRMLAFVLALVLLLGFGAVASAEEAPPAINWDEFYIITQPPEEQTIAFGESFTLSVEVNVPEGVTRVTYQWRRSGGNITDATEAVLTLSPDCPGYPRAQRPYLPATEHYRVIITAVVEEAEYGDVIETRTLTSQTTTVTVPAERNRHFGDTLRNIWYGIVMVPFMLPIIFAFGIFPWLIYLPILAVLGLPILIINWLISLFR